MNLKLSATRTAVLKALRDAIDAELASSRTEVLDGLLDAQEQFGVKSIDVTLPDGTKVATATLNDKKTSFGVPVEDSFVDWVLDRWPDEVETQIRPAFRKKLLDRFEVGPDGNVVDTATGEVVPGVLPVPASSPSSFTLRYTATGRDSVAAAYREGALESLLPDLSSRELEE